MVTSRHSSKSIIFRCTMGGILFGLCFPLFALIFEFIQHKHPFSFVSAYEAHIHNRLLFMIDTAPFFLGLFAYFIGVKSANLSRINHELELQSYEDDLTSLHNRRYVKYRVEKLISNMGPGSRLGIFLLDLNRFKNINDTMGHSFGDKLLQSISSRLSEGFGSVENLVRLGGDEFLVIAPEMNSKEDFEDIKNMITGSFSTPFSIDGNIISASSSIGVSIYPNDGDDIEILLKKADIAMYKCKLNSHCQCQVYKDSMSGDLSDIFSIENYLKRSLENDELHLLYQPIVNISKNRLLGVEALLRWNSKELGPVPPGRFIPIAEECGFILDIGKYVLEEACIQGKKWHDKGMFLYLSVNVSVEQLKDVDFISGLKSILEDTGFEPSFLNLEITENISISSIPNIEVLFKSLKAIGVKTSFDDFGTGYSSFAQLKKLSIDTLKIDKSFIDNVHINVSDASITSAMINLARNLNLNVIAEGVETEEQLAHLKKEGCANVQGYFFSKPVSAEEIESFYLSYGDTKEKVL